MRNELSSELELAPHLVVVNGRKGIQRMAQRARARGELERVLPGVYAPAGSVDLQVRAVALSRAHPDAVIAGRAAASLLWWPELAVGAVDVISRHRVADAPGFRWRRGSVPPELVVESNNGIRVTAPSLSVLDLVGELGGQPIDEALRRGAADLPSLWEALALTPGRRGNSLRRELLHDSRDLPWSEAERALHRIFRSLPPTWCHATNHPVALAGSFAFLDLALPPLLLGFEVDGREYHTSAEAFARDRRRDAVLAELGWLIVRFAAVTVLDDPDWVRDRLRGIIATRAAELGLL